MATEKQIAAARENIKKAQEARLKAANKANPGMSKAKADTWKDGW